MAHGIPPILTRPAIHHPTSSSPFLFVIWRARSSEERIAAQQQVKTKWLPYSHPNPNYKTRPNWFQLGSSAEGQLNMDVLRGLPAQDAARRYALIPAEPSQVCFGFVKIQTYLIEDESAVVNPAGRSAGILLDHC